MTFPDVVVPQTCADRVQIDWPARILSPPKTLSSQGFLPLSGGSEERCKEGFCEIFGQIGGMMLTWVGKQHNILFL